MKIIVIAGFLGAGKTSLLMRVARFLNPDGRSKVAIVENEMGKVGVDNQLLGQTGLEMREIFGGCVCCSLGPNLLIGLKQIQEGFDPDWVIIEPSGVAAPDLIRQLLQNYDGPIQSMQLVVLFDIERFAAISHVARPMVEGSVASADVVIINKIDLAKEGQLADLVDQIHQLRPEVPIVPMCTQDGRGFEKLTALLEDHPTPDAHAADHGHSHHHHAGEPLAEAREFDLQFAGPQPTADLIRRLIETTGRMAVQIDANRPAVIGHVKLAVRIDGCVAVIRATSSQREPDVTGELPETLDRARVTLNALAYAIDGDELARIADAAVAQLV